MRILVAVSLLAVLALTGGCELFAPVTTQSPATGAAVTEDQLALEEQRQVEQLASEAEAERLRAEAELARVQREAEFQIMREQAATDARLAEIRFEAENRMEGVRVDLAANAEARGAAIAGLRASYAAARSDIEAKRQSMSDIANFGQAVLGNPVVQGAAASNPLVLGGLGLAGLVLGRLTGKHAGERVGRETTRQEAEAARRAEHAAWDESKRETERDNDRAMLLSLMASLSGTPSKTGTNGA